MYASPMGSPTTVGRYRIVERIGAGGMGEIYLAHVEALGGVEKWVVLKVMRPGALASGELQHLFLSEMKVAMLLSHANVVQAFDVGLVEDRYYLAMEYVDGADLARLIARARERGQPIPQAHAILIAVEALKGLDYAHRRQGAEGRPLGIVHRDISPGNILVSYEGEVKVADFGIAKSALRTHNTEAGLVRGKVPYMAPEQLAGDVVDCRADIYGVGTVLYEMLTGQRVYPGVAGHLGELVTAITTGRFARPSDLIAGLPSELEAVVLRSLSVDPGARYPSAAAMRRELETLALAKGYMLSSASLADLVGHLEPRKSADTVPEGSDDGGYRSETDGSRDASDRPRFDDLLNAELCMVDSDAPFTVLGRRLPVSADSPAPPRITVGSPADSASVHEPVKAAGSSSSTRRLGAMSAATLEPSPPRSERPFSARPRHDQSSAAPERSAARSPATRGGERSGASSTGSTAAAVSGLRSPGEVRGGAWGPTDVDGGLPDAEPGIRARVRPRWRWVAAAVVLATLTFGATRWALDGAAGGSDDVESATITPGKGTTTGAVGVGPRNSEPDGGASAPAPSVAADDHGPAATTSAISDDEAPSSDELGADRVGSDSGQSGPREGAASAPPRPISRPLTRTHRTARDVGDPDQRLAGTAASSDQRSNERTDAYATIDVNTDPWSEVHVDGHRVGETPLRGHTVATGRHVILLRNSSADLERRIVIELAAGERRVVTMSLR